MECEKNHVIVKLDKNQFTILDAEDAFFLSWFRWRAVFKNKKNYYCDAYISIKGKTHRVSLARLIMNAPSHLCVDHINGNTLDNRKENLRLCTIRQNSRNAAKRRSKTGSKFKGVSFRKDRNRWKASININRKQISLGCYDTEEEAAFAYNKNAKIFFGKFAWLNDLGYRTND